MQVIDQGRIEVDPAFILEVAGQLAQHQLVERGGVVDALDLGLHQLVEVADGGKQVDRRVEHQDFFEVEAFAGFIQMADKGRIQCAQAIARQVVVGDGQLGLLGAHGLHHMVQILGVVLADARCGQARSRAHEVIAGGR